jgi:hypothetical protein
MAVASFGTDVGVDVAYLAVSSTPSNFRMNVLGESASLLGRIFELVGSGDTGGAEAKYML